MKKFNVGIQLFGVRNSMNADLLGTLKALREMGYDYVELAGYYGKTADEIKEILDSVGLKTISVHQKLDFFNENPDEKAEFLKAFGTKYVIAPSYPQNMLPNTDRWDESVALLNRIADLCEKHGMTLGYHNHDFEYAVHNGKYLMDYMIGCVPEGKIVPELDTCWVHYAGVDPISEIKKYNGRLPIVHLKDYVCTKRGGGPVYDLIGTDGKVTGKRDQGNDGFEFRPLGQGVQDFAAILAACEECGTETVIVEQDNVYGGMTDLEAARLSREYLKNTFGI